MNNYHATLVIGFVFILFPLGCATSHFGTGTVKQEASDTPVQFMVGSFKNDKMAETAGDEGCRNPLIDPRNNARLYLVRSSTTGMGDYRVPDGAYGVGKNELLRISCSSGKAIGIVRK